MCVCCACVLTALVQLFAYDLSTYYKEKDTHDLARSDSDSSKLIYLSPSMHHYLFLSHVGDRNHNVWSTYAPVVLSSQRHEHASHKPDSTESKKKNNRPPPGRESERSVRKRWRECTRVCANLRTRIQDKHEHLHTCERARERKGCSLSTLGLCVA